MMAKFFMEAGKGSPNVQLSPEKTQAVAVEWWNGLPITPPEHDVLCHAHTSRSTRLAPPRDRGGDRAAHDRAGPASALQQAETHRQERQPRACRVRLQARWRRSLPDGDLESRLGEESRRRTAVRFCREDLCARGLRRVRDRAPGTWRIRRSVYRRHAQRPPR